MEVWSFIFFIILCMIFDIIIEYFSVYFAVKHNKELFYDLHREEIIKTLNKLDRKDMKE